MSSRSCTVTNKSKLLACTVASSFVCTPPLAVTTVVGVLFTPFLSSAAASRSFPDSMCMEAPEATTNSLFCGLIDDGAGRHHASECEKNVALFLIQVSFEFAR